MVTNIWLFCARHYSLGGLGGLACRAATLARLLWCFSTREYKAYIWLLCYSGTTSYKSCKAIDSGVAAAPSGI